MSDPRRPYIIGIVGAIGSGKSTVAELLERQGAIRIDADQLCHELLDQPDVIVQVSRSLGDDVVDADGRIDRKAVADRVFGDADQLRRLGAILHPRVRRMIRDRIDQFVGVTLGTKIVLEVALLLESGLEAMCDTIVYVNADRGVRERRVVEDRGWSLNELHRRERHQLADEDKRAAADIIIDNTRTLDHTQRQISEFWRGLGR